MSLCKTTSYYDKNLKASLKERLTVSPKTDFDQNDYIRFIVSQIKKIKQDVINLKFVENLIDKDTYDRSISEFKTDVLEIVNDHLKSWIGTDQNHPVNVGISQEQIDSIGDEILQQIDSYIAYLNNVNTKKDAEIIDVTDINQKQAESLEIKELEDTFFREAIGPRDLRQTLIRRLLFQHCIIGEITQKSGNLVEQLNDNIKKVKNDLFKDITDYLNSTDVLFDKKRNYNDPTAVFEAFLSKVSSYMKNSGNYSELMQNAYIDYIQGKNTSDIKLLKAVMAYINLLNIDYNIQEVFGDYIKINQEADESSIDKYSFNIDKFGRRTGFIEINDATKSIGRISKLIITTIPRKVYGEENNVSAFSLSLTDFNNAFSSILEIFTKNIDPTSKNEELQTDINLFNLITNIQDNPVENLKQILHILFVRKTSLLSKIPDINVVNTLYSVYQALYDKNNKNYFEQYALSDHRSIHNQRGYNILELIAGVVLRVRSANYLQDLYSYNDNKERFQFSTVTKEKFRERKLQEIRTAVNNLIFKTINRENDLKTYFSQSNYLDEVDKYGLRVLKATNSYSFNIGDQVLTVSTKTKNILDNTGQDLGKIKISLTVNDGVESYDLIEKLENTLGNIKELGSFIEEAKKEGTIQNQLCTFIKIYTGLDLAGSDSVTFKVYQSLLNGWDPHYAGRIKGFLLSAIKNCIIHNSRMEHDNLQIDISYRQFMDRYGLISEANFRTENGVSVVLSVTNDPWVAPYNKAFSISTGRSVSATTKDFERKTLGNFRNSFLGSNIHYQLNKMKGTNSSPLLFVTANRHHLDSQVYLNTEVKNRLGQNKKIKNLTLGELLYQDMWLHFYDAHYSSGHVYVQPATYADKTSIVKYGVTSAPYFNLSTDEVLSKFKSTIGTFYKNEINQIVKDFSKVFGKNMTVKEINDELKKLTYRELLYKFNQKGIELKNEWHVRAINDNGKTVLQLNETILYHNELFNNTTKLKERFKQEEIHFVNNLLETGDRFRVWYDRETTALNKSTNPIARAIVAYCNDEKNKTKLANFADKWVTKDGRLILAIKKDPSTGKSEAITRGSDYLNESDNIFINPLLSKYFYVTSLLSNNLRLALTGTEAVHPDKSKVLKNAYRGLSTEVKRAIEVNEVSSNSKADLFINKEVIRNTLITEDAKTEFDNFVQLILHDTETFLQGTQSKRNSIIPATSQLMLRGSSTGVPDYMNVAFIDDMIAETHTFRGDVKKNNEVNDGSAKILYYTARMENNSLQDQQVGNEFKKPIWHYFDPVTGTCVFVKFATDTLTNEKLNYLGSDVSMYNLFKKMTDIKWNGKIDLLKQNGKNISFNDMILGNRDLYYKDINGNYVKIIGFGKNEFGYYTEEKACTIAGVTNSTTKTVKVYHRFNNITGEHIKTTDTSTVDLENTHTIDSIFELFNAMGGITAQSKQDGILVNSDISHEAVLGFILNVEENGVQVLKDKMIHYAVNKSAVKNGGSNINPKETWADDSELYYTKLSTAELGIQLDAEHDIETGDHLTEFSQVISALESGGRLHHVAKQVYRALGKVAEQSLHELLHDVEEYLQKRTSLSERESKSKLYETIVQTIFKACKDSTNKADITQEIIDSIKKEFKLKNTDHILDSKHFPLSDANIYSQILPSFISYINSVAIKRKYPGTGFVMISSYGYMQTYNIDSEFFNDPEVWNNYSVYRAKNFTFEDIYNLAIKKKILPDIKTTDSVVWRKAVVSNFLNILQNEVKWESERTAFQPVDRVQIGTTNADGTTATNVVLNLEAVDDYYKFLDGNWWHFIKDKDVFINYIWRTIEANKEYFNEQEIQEIRASNNTEETKATMALFLIKNTSQTINFLNQFGIYSSWANILTSPGLQYRFCITQPRNLAPQRISWKYVGRDGQTHSMNYFALPKVKQMIESGTVNANLSQEILDGIDKKTMELNGVSYEIFDVRNEAAELIIPNIYNEQFNNTRGKSLAECLNMEGRNFLPSQGYVTKGMAGADFGFVRANGVNTYVQVSGTVDPKGKYKRWENVKLKKNKDGSYDVYIANRRGDKIFSIGKRIIRNDITYDEKSKSYLLDGEPVLNQGKYSNYKGQVFEYIEFVHKYQFVIANKNGRITRPILFKIDSEEAKKAGISITDIINGIYNNDSYYGYHVYGNLRSGNVSTIEISKEAAEVLKEGIKGDSYIEEYSQRIKGELNGNILTKSDTTDPDNTHGIQYLYNELKNKYAEEIRSSFDTSLYFTSSRIPAQHLQSFMQMRVSAFSTSRSNVAYVSWYQTYIQGSDYDIDKAYLMGNEFTGNGKYIGWSSLFDYSSAENLRASQELPLPENVLYTASSNQGIDASAFQQKINASTTTAEKLRNYAELLIFLQNNRKEEDSHLYIRGLSAETIKAINRHESTFIPTKNREKAFKNFISFNIRRIVQDVRNATSAYVPVEMENTRSAATLSPIDSEQRVISMLNPASRLKMQVSNLVGKDTIAIFANGLKLYFNSTYYYNEGIRSNDPEWEENLKFQKTFTRIKGRDIGKPEKITINTIAGINIEGVDSEYAKTLLLRTDVPPDQILSELLSAATDNAKELILSQIKGNSKLASMYIQLILYGFNLRECVTFMTSPVGILIDDLSKTNIFEESSLSVNGAISLLYGNINVNKYSMRGAPKRITFEDIGEVDDVDEIQLTRVKVKAQNLLKLIGMKDEKGSFREKCQKYFTQRLTGIKLTENQSTLYNLIKDSELGINKLGLVLTLSQMPELEVWNMIAQYNELKVPEMPSDENTEESKNDKEWEKYEADLAEYESQVATISNNIVTYLEKMITKFSQDILQEIKELGTAPPKDVTLLSTNKNDAMDEIAEDIDYTISRIRQAIAKYEGDSWLEKYENFMADLSEYKEVHSAADELTTFSASMLNLNQGIPTSKEKLVLKLRGFEKAVTFREREFGISSYSNKQNNIANWIKEKADLIMEHNPLLSRKKVESILATAYGNQFLGNFNVRTWLDDIHNNKQLISKYEFNGTSIVKTGETYSYRDFTAMYYNTIKVTINIMDAINKIPQYHSILTILNAVTIVDDSIFKSKLINATVSRIRQINGKDLSEQQLKELTQFITAFMIKKFVDNEKFKFPIFKGSKYLTDQFQEKESVDSFVTTATGFSGIAGFKYFMENELIPSLILKGSYRDIDGNNVIERRIAPNDFIKSLMVGRDYNFRPFYKLKFDPSNIAYSAETRSSMIKAMQGMVQLSDYTLLGVPLSDYFIMYNLVVNRNQWGDNTLTSMLKAFVNNGKSVTLIEKFLEFVGNDLDYANIDTSWNALEKMGFYLNDFYIYMAKKYSRASEEFLDNPYARDKSGQLQKRNSISNSYFDAVNEEYPTLDITNEEVLRNAYLYGVLNFPNAEQYLSTRDKLYGDNINTIVRSLTELLKLNKLKLYFENC